MYERTSLNALQATPLKSATDNNDSPQARCREIVDTIRNIKAPGTTKTFHDINAREHAYITYVLDGGGKDEPLCGTRLTYVPIDNELIAVMPREIYKAPFDQLQLELTNAVRLIPLDFDSGNNKVVVQVRTNSEVEGQTISGCPDTQIRMYSLSDHPHLSEIQPYFFLESSFSQTDQDADRKLKAYIQSFPKTIAAVKISIRESRPFHFPDTNSDLARSLAGRKVLRWHQWKPTRTNANALGPIITHGITWIDLSMIEVRIWVRNIRHRHRYAGAFGTLHPTIDMADVGDKLDMALRRIRDVGVRYAVKSHVYHLGREPSDGSDSDSDGDDERAEDHGPSSMDVDLVWSSKSESDWHSDSEESDLELHGLAEAQAWSPPNPSVNWETVIRRDMTLATWNTAYQRYSGWHTSLRKDATDTPA